MSSRGSTRTLLDTNPKPQLVQQLLGEMPLNHRIILTYEDYELVYKTRHDIIHSVICDKFNIPFGERTVETILHENKVVPTSRFYEDVKTQTPDYFQLSNKIATIYEITVSNDPLAKRRKAAKYALLCKMLRDEGFEIIYKIFVIIPSNIFVNRDELISLGLDDTIIDFSKTVCENTMNLLRLIHKTSDGRYWYNRFFEILDEGPTLNFKHSWVEETYRDLPNKCFHDDDDFKSTLYSKTTSSLTKDDEKFLDHCLSITKTLKNPMTKKEKFDEIGFIKHMEEKSTTREYRSSMPMSYLDVGVIDSAVRSTQDDWNDLSILSGFMIDCDHPVIRRMGKLCGDNIKHIRTKSEIKNEDFLFVCKFNEEEKRLNGLEGPGRKKYLKTGSLEHLQSESHSGYALHPGVDVSDIEHISFLLSERERIKETGDVMVDSKSLSQMTGVGLNYVKLCQTIFREININSMRGDRRHKMIIKPTGAKGIYIALFPGTKLRCGELSNLVWYKIIVVNDCINSDMMYSNHWIFKRLTRDKYVSYTDWLSCDVHRLDHYIRCYDRIIMSYLAIMSQKFKGTATDEDFKSRVNDDNQTKIQTLIRTINEDDSNTLGLIILIYLEDKRSTSKMLQNVRYLVMTSISIYPKYNAVMEKFKEPIRSPLQLYLLKKLMLFVVEMTNWNVSKNVRFGHVKYDQKSHVFLDMMGGSNIRMPRPLVTDSRGFAEFSEILSEMYFTMLFNKNQDDPTHASFQILDKILEGEENFDKVKSNENHLGYSTYCNDEEFATLISMSEKTHMFSRRSIEIGSKLLREKHGDDFNDQIIRASRNQNLDKTLDQFATYKSSSVPTNLLFNPLESKQNSRRKCIEGVNELLSQNLRSSYEVAVEKRRELTYFDVFKKNQIGGVREILILPISTRIRINILETLSRNICKFDKREVLTHGAVKNESIKSVLYSAKKLSGTRAPVHLTFDKSKWGPSFVPIQFLYLFTPFKKELGGLYPYIMDLLIRHQNKHCMMPDRLTAAWYKDQNNNKHHSDPRLQKQKEIFLSNHRIDIKNESNMGQGILHYTSSLLHLCMIEFRDRLYKKWCGELGLDSNDHEDLLSSDDSYTILCPELSRNLKKNLVALKIDMFLKCQRMSELMFNCRTSAVKSSINPLIGEFNSLFITNMTFIPTLMKFCLSSVHPVNTDSFYRMVKESYGSCRQIVENGGGLDLYLVASNLNKQYCEEIYHTYPGGINDLSQFGVCKYPYHIGTYPIFNPSLMIIFGPEYYNYRLFKKDWPSMNERERRLFSSSHKIIKGGLIETMAEFEEGDTVLGGLMRIEANIGPIRQLERIKNRALLTQDELASILEKDPIMIIKRPKTIEDIIFRTTQKLYTNGAKEAVKTIAASIFYGRVSATVSANAFYIPNGSIIKKTYRECLSHLIETESPVLQLEDHLRFIYPKYVDYELFFPIEEMRFKFYPRHPMEIQTVQTLTTHKIYTKLTQPVESLLSYKWENKLIPDHLSSKVERDFKLIKTHFPLIKDSIDDTLEQFSGTRKDQTKSVLLLILKMFSLRDRSFKGVIYGPGSNDVNRTYDVLLEKNISTSYTTELLREYEYLRTEMSFEKIFCAHNHTILQHFSSGEVKGNMWELVKEVELMSFFQDPKIPKNIKKRIFMCAVTNGFIENSETWSNRVGIILHYWYIKQNRINDKYQGSFDIILFMGQSKLTYYYDDSTKKAHIGKVFLDDPDLIYLFFQELAELLQTTVDKLVEKAEPGNWVVVKDRVLKTSDKGFKISELENLTPISYLRCTLSVDEKVTRLIDEDEYRIFNIDTGLLSTDYVPDTKYDFSVFGLRFIDLCNIGAFQQNFKVFYKSRESCLQALHTLDVPRPIITELTRNRLKLSKEWLTKTVDDNKDEEIVIEDNTDVIGDLMDLDIMDDDILKMISSASVDNELSNVLDFIMQTDAIYSMKTNHKVHQSRKIFTTIINLKYDLIVRQLLSDIKMNRQMISMASQMFKPPEKKWIIYSMISFYDRTYLYDNQKSPGGVKLDIGQSFMEKFGFSSSDEEMIINI
jgi:hypothetical protein